MSALRQFYDRMGAYFADPSRVDELRAAFPGWSAAPRRLAIYGRFVKAHVHGALAKNYPLVRGVVGEETWARLSAAYFDEVKATHFEVNQAAAAFPSFLADKTEAFGLPSFVPALARFEWADFDVYTCAEEIPTSVQALTVNPTLQILQHPFRLAAWVRHAAPRPSAPQAADETVLMWRHPTAHKTMFVVAESWALFVLKMAAEGIDVAAAARQAGVAETDVQTWVSAFVKDGLVLAS